MLWYKWRFDFPVVIEYKRLSPYSYIFIRVRHSGTGERDCRYGKETCPGYDWASI